MGDVVSPQPSLWQAPLLMSVALCSVQAPAWPCGAPPWWVSGDTTRVLLRGHPITQRVARPSCFLVLSGPSAAMLYLQGDRGHIQTWPSPAAKACLNDFLPSLQLFVIGVIF